MLLASSGKQRINTTISDSKDVLIAEITLPQPNPNPGTVSLCRIRSEPANVLSHTFLLSRDAQAALQQNRLEHLFIVALSAQGVCEIKCIASSKPKIVYRHENGIVLT